MDKFMDYQDTSTDLGKAIKILMKILGEKCRNVMKYVYLASKASFKYYK